LTFSLIRSFQQHATSHLSHLELTIIFESSYLCLNFIFAANVLSDFESLGVFHLTAVTVMANSCW